MSDIPAETWEAVAKRQDAEIARLQDAGLKLVAAHSAKDKEIERLKIESREFRCQNTELKVLIAELADAANGYLENDGSRGKFWIVDLADYREKLESSLQRAREATE